MASARKTVLDTVVSALGNSTGIQTATRELEHWWEKRGHEFPIVTVSDGETELEYLTHQSTSESDMEARLMLTVRGYVFDAGNTLATKRTNLASDIEKTMIGSTDISGVTVAVHPRTITTDRDMIENYSIVECEYEVVYHYNHLSP